MRAIEFRAWANNTMYYFVELTSFKDGSLGIGVAQNGFHDMHTASSDVVLMQYTGLQDAKGNKVFEGDILESHMGNLVVTFTNGKFIAEMKDKQPGKWDYHIEGRLFYQVDIVGNIYEGINEQKIANIGTDRDG